MTGNLYDHIMAVTIVGALFLVAVVEVPNISYVNLLYVDQQQVRNIALDTLKTMLLDTGYPENWGSTNDFDSEKVERFGLALAGSASSYVLDPNKVQRLIVGNSAGFIKYEDIRAKLKLQGYGFTFRIIPPFKVIVNDEDFDGESNPLGLDDLVQGIEVFVANNAGQPVPKALVYATLVCLLNDVEHTLYVAKASNSTNPVGKCTIKPDIPTGSSGILDFVIVFKVTVADVTTITSSYFEGFSEQRVINASIVGDNITLSIPEGPGWEKDSAGARWVNNVAIVNENEVWNMYKGTKSNDDKITWGGTYWGWSMMFSGLSYSNPLFMIFSLSVPNPRRSFLFMGPEANSKGFRVVSCGDPKGASPIVTAQRCVIISGMVYTAELTLRKE